MNHRKPILLWIVMVVGLFSSLHAQAPDTLWTRTYGDINDEHGYSIYQTNDLGYIIAGMTTSFGALFSDVYIIKTDSLGDTLWTKTYGGSDFDEAYCVRQTLDGGYIIAGQTFSFGAGHSDVYLLKLNPIGDTIWTKTFGDTSYEYGYSVEQTADSGFIVAGHTFSIGSGQSDVYLIKTNINGDMVWYRTFGGANDDKGRAVQQTSDGGYIITGLTESLDPSRDVYLIKTDTNGDTLWTRNYGGQLNDMAFSVKQTPDSGYIIAGWTYSFGAGDADVYLIRIDSLGDTIWTTAVGGQFNDVGFSVRQTFDSKFIVVGWTNSFGSGARDVYLARVNESGSTLWTKTFGGINNDVGNSFIQALDGGFAIVGYTYSFGVGNSDVWLIKTEPDIGIGEQPAIPPKKKEIRLTYHPNPFTTVTSIQLIGASKNTKSNLTIFDSSGRLVKSIKLATSTYQLGADLVPGIYFLKLNGKPIGKVVKVR
jgi:hypothetical protein